MATNYVVTAKKPTVVSHALVGNFTDDDDLNLIIARVNRLEIHLVTTDGLRAIQEVAIFGKISEVQLMRVRGEARDSIVVVTEKYDMAVLAWKDGKLATRAAGHIADKVGRPAETGLICCVHHSGLIAFRIYDGILKIVEWDDGAELRAFNVRFENVSVIDVQFLKNAGEEILLSYIYQDGQGRHLKTVELNLAEKEMKTIGQHEGIESEARMIIPVPEPYGGVIIIGQDSIMYNRKDNSGITISPPKANNSQLQCYCPIDPDGQRFLLGGLSGELVLLLLDTDPLTSTVKDMRVERLGRSSIPECLVYLDNGCVFVGSRFGDSQLVRLSTEPDESGSFVSVLESYVNLAPIRDMVLIDYENGQTQLVTCSGAYKDGSLRVIRNGIGIEELASVDLHGVKGMFPLRTCGDSDDFLVLSLADRTHILKISGEDLEEYAMNGLEAGERTLFAGCLSVGCLLQVTPSSVRIVPASGGEPVIWMPDTPSKEITCCSVNQLSGQIGIASRDRVFILEITISGIAITHDMVLEKDCSCLDISPVSPDGRSTLLGLGTWFENQCRLYAITATGLELLGTDPMARTTLPRSVLLRKFDENVYMLVGLGDGTLYYFHATSDGLAEGKRASLGTMPLSLHSFQSSSTHHVFVCSDRPAVIYSSNGKLVFSNVNVKVVSHMCSLSSNSFRDCLVMCDSETMVIGRVDDIQKLHIRTVPLGESPSRVAHLKDNGSIAVLTCREKNSEMMSVARSAKRNSCSAHPAATREGTEAHEIHSIVLMDQNTFECLHAHELGPHEEALSIHAIRMGDDPQEYLVVGTAVVFEDETESRVGRLLVFSTGQGTDRLKMTLVHEKEIKGAAFSIATLHGKLLVSVNSSVRLFEWTPEKELRLECSHFQYICALYLKTKGDVVLVGDVMRSMGLITYKQLEASFEEVAKDPQTHWMTAIEVIDSETFLGADSNLNLFTNQIETGAQNADERQKMVEAGMYYLGDSVNVFRAGSLVTQHVEGGFPCANVKPILFGTVEGALGVVVQLDKGYYKVARDVEKAVAAYTDNAMRVPHSSYRQFYTEKQCLSAFGFVDGDLVEGLLDMPRETAKRIVKDVAVPTEYQEEDNSEAVLKLVEDFSRAH